MEGGATDWTLRTLRLFLEGQIEGLRLLVSTAFTAQEKAILKAEAANEERFRSVNEFRSTLSDQAGTFLTRTEYETAHSSLEDKVNRLTDRVNIREGNSDGRTQLWAVMVAAVAVLGTIVVITNVLIAK